MSDQILSVILTIITASTPLLIAERLRAASATRH